ncbi:hypothetical protein PR202_ga25712 [Eleusine coracana subsp. coracana]|uniref:1-phosphatidylinositol-4-phosphate 5-kinase n=1 Tax=Eleusine coracana subsp. coracana TaxID=191504 RepID=A0AAV5D9Z0_ELECO|nr:hypothetical protein PR202_ga25712 [Eleusine coracana subsp. coracana]
MCKRARHARRRVSPMPGEDPDAGAPSCSSSSSGSGSGAPLKTGTRSVSSPTATSTAGQWRGAVPHGLRQVPVGGRVHVRRGMAARQGHGPRPLLLALGRHLRGRVPRRLHPTAPAPTWAPRGHLPRRVGAEPRARRGGEALRQRRPIRWRVAGRAPPTGAAATRGATAPSTPAGGARASSTDAARSCGPTVTDTTADGRPAGRAGRARSGGPTAGSTWASGAARRPVGPCTRRACITRRRRAGPRTRDPREVFARELPECVRSGTGTEGQSALKSLRSLKWLVRSVSGRGSSSSSRSTGSGGSLVHFWGSDGEVKCDIGDDWRRRSLREGKGLPPPSPAPHLAKGTPLRVSRQQGLTIAKGHKNYELMLNLQLGIRHAVGRQGQPLLDLKSSAFDPKEKVWTKFPPEGSKYTPPHNSCDFKWKDYCPKVFRLVFTSTIKMYNVCFQPFQCIMLNNTYICSDLACRTLRKLFKVDPADYMLSLCGDDALRELSSPGKSGSFFYLTNDDRYMIKTMKKAEVKMLLKMLPAYYKHVRAFENTLVTKFFGLHCVKAGVHQKKVRFVIMGNLFCSDHTIHRRFDLKGSSLGRITDKPHAEIDEYTTLKDLDLNFIFRLQKQWFQEFQRQVDKDCEFLEKEKIMDYSLLVGVHFRGAIDIDGDKPATPRLSRWDRDHFLSDPNRWSTIKLGANMLSRAELTTRKNDNDVIGEPTGEYCDVILYFGIIDILQDYDIGKKLEHAYKSFQYDSTSISAVDPRQYSKRFRDFIYKAFQEDINQTAETY